MRMKAILNKEIIEIPQLPQMFTGESSPSSYHFSFTTESQDEREKTFSVIYDNDELENCANSKKRLLDYRRKDKSLEELSKRFLDLFCRKTDFLISLDQISNKLSKLLHSKFLNLTRLDVERRRIYDIINILESLKIVKRKAKNLYIWTGLAKIDSTLKEYQCKGFDLYLNTTAKNKYLMYSPL